MRGFMAGFAGALKLIVLKPGDADGHSCTAKDRNLLSRMLRSALVKSVVTELTARNAIWHDNKFQIQTLEEEAISGQSSTKWARHQDILTE
jgi:hypothetical protein